MKYLEQEKHNMLVTFNFERCAMQELMKTNGNYIGKRLRSCTATVYETDNYYILKSYNSFIACIDKAVNVLYDALRYEYGYTATSAHHISKFAKDYLDKTRPSVTITWRPIKTK